MQLNIYSYIDKCPCSIYLFYSINAHLTRALRMLTHYFGLACSQSLHQSERWMGVTNCRVVPLAQHRAALLWLIGSLVVENGVQPWPQHTVAYSLCVGRPFERSRKKKQQQNQLIEFRNSTVDVIAGCQWQWRFSERRESARQRGRDRER